MKADIIQKKIDAYNKEQEAFEEAIDLIHDEELKNQIEELLKIAQGATQNRCKASYFI